MTRRLLLELTVEGEPRSKGRPRFANGHAFTPPATREAEARFGWEARAAHRGRPFAGPLEVVIVFHTQSKRRSDLDNKAKLVLDAGNGVLWEDDSQIRALQVRREVGRPRTELRVYEIVGEAAGRGGGDGVD